MTIYQSTAYRVRQLFSTLAAVTASNPVLLEGERWHEKSTTGRFTGRTKTGDGVVTGGGTTITGTAFNDLPFDPSGGASLSDAIPQTLGTAAAGTGTEASRNDHRHAMPTAAQVGADATGTAAAAVAAHVAAADPHPVYTTTAEAAAVAPVQSVAGRTGAVALAAADVSGAVSSSDTRLSDSREWSAATATQAEAEAGTSATRLAFTPLRVFQAVAAWWVASAAKTKVDGIATGATANQTDAYLLSRANHTGTQAAATITGLGSLATQSGTFSGASSGTNTGDQTITLTGEVTGSGTGSFAATVDNAAVIGKVLSGYTSGAGTVAATDSILQAIQKLNGNDAAFLTSATAATTYQPLKANLTALGNNNPAYYLARANHTGTQAAATITGLGSLATQSGTFSGASSGTNTGDQTITLTGEVTGSGTGSFAATVDNAAVIGKVLSGYTSGAGTVAATDSILQAIQKLNGNDAAFLTSATAATTYQPLKANLTALGNNNPAYYLARANHTGTQAGSTVTGALTASGMTMATARILGRSTASTGAVEEFALLGLAFNGANLATLADLVIPLSDETTALTASSSVAKVTIPYWPRATVLTDLPIWAVATAPTGAALQFDIKIGGTSIYTTLPTIAVSSTNSTASAGTFSTAFISGGQSIAAGASVAFFVTQIGSTVAGAGLKLALLTRRAG